jgi:hypothetical protein
VRCLPLKIDSFFRSLELRSPTKTPTRFFSWYTLPLLYPPAIKHGNGKCAIQFRMIFPVNLPFRGGFSS